MAKLRPRITLSLMLLAACPALTANAVLRVWTGAATMDNHWTVAANWQTVAPFAGDDLEFPQGASHPNNNNNYTDGTTFNSLFFWNSGGNQVNGFTLSGNSISLNAGVTASNNASSTWGNTIGNAFLLNSNQTFTAGPLTSLLFQGAINLNGNNLTVDTTAGSPVDVHAIVSGAGNLVKTNAGTLTLWSNNTYTGTTVLKGGTLQVYGTQPASPVNLFAGTFYGQGTVGPITALGSGSPSTVVFRPGLTRSTMTSSNLTLNSAATFQVNLNGLVAGASYDTLLVHGSVSLNDATLLVSLGFTPSVGDSFFIINNDGTDPVSGTFNGLPEGTLFNVGSAYFRITYTGGDGNDVVLTRVSRVLTVTNNADSGTGSLRDALASAVDTDTITFAPNVTGAITDSAELLVAKSVNIAGPGPAILAINANSRRAFHVTNGVTAVIAGLAITNGVGGTGGGAVWNDHCIVTISNCLISQNQEMAIRNNGQSGSAVMTLVGCTLTRNSAESQGAAIWNDASLGSAVLNITNCTFCTNSAPEGSAINTGAGSGSSAPVKIFASTFVANTGSAILNTGSSNNTAVVEIGDTIFQALSPSIAILNSGGTVLSDGYNLTSDNGSGLLTNATDQLNTNAKLGSLTDNGGPTPTFALLWGSPAIDKGKSFGVAADQRGMPRPHDLSSVTNASGGDGSDIGAFEFIPGPAQFTSISRAGIAAQLQGAGLSNLIYTIQAASNLNPVISWSNLGAATGNVSGVFSFTDTNAALFPTRFYRALSP
jgi:autotransporter-associated beta strand protein